MSSSVNECRRLTDENSFDGGMDQIRWGGQTENSMFISLHILHIPNDDMIPFAINAIQIP